MSSISEISQNNFVVRWIRSLFSMDEYTIADENRAILGDIKKYGRDLGTHIPSSEADFPDLR